MDFFSALLDGIVGLVVKAVNALIAGLGAAINALISILPPMPSLPAPPDALVTAESWVAWVFPIQTVLDVLTFALAMRLLWALISIALRWAKMLNDSGGA